MYVNVSGCECIGVYRSVPVCLCENACVYVCVYECVVCECVQVCVCVCVYVSASGCECIRVCPRVSM